MATFTGSNRRDRHRGTRENDRIDGLGGDDWLSGGAGDDTLIGGRGSDELHGGSGRDYLSGGRTTSARGDFEQDLLFGEAGYDFILGGYNDIIDGGENSAYLVLDWSSLPFFRGRLGVSDEFANGTGWVRNVDTISLELTRGNDRLAEN